MKRILFLGLLLWTYSNTMYATTPAERDRSIQRICDQAHKGYPGVASDWADLHRQRYSISDIERILLRSYKMKLHFNVVKDLPEKPAPKESCRMTWRNMLGSQ